MTQRDDPTQENAMLYEDMYSIGAASTSHIYLNHLRGPIPCGIHERITQPSHWSRQCLTVIKGHMVQHYPPWESHIARASSQALTRSTIFGVYFVIVVDWRSRQAKVVVPLCALCVGPKSIQAPPERLKARRLDYAISLDMSQRKWSWWRTSRCST